MPKDINQQKADMRRDIKQRLKELKSLQSIHDSQSQLAAERLLEHSLIQQAETVLAFVSYGTEINTRWLIEGLLDAGKQVALPRTTGDTMTFHLLPPAATAGNWSDSLEPGDFGILVPTSSLPLFEPSPSNGPAAVVLPGLAFDKEKNRLGKGKGFYDRYLATWITVPTIGFCFDCQMVDAVPATPLDAPVHAIVTDLQTI